MTSQERRDQLINKLKSTTKPYSGNKLSKELEVSRQVIVQDIALLRAQGHKIISTSRGYLLDYKKEDFQRVFKVKHTFEEVEEELNLFVDHGCKVIDIFIFHKIYGLIKAPLNLTSRLEVSNYLETIKSSKSQLLSSATSGYHYHTIQAPKEEILDLIEKKLSEKGFLAKLTGYEPVDFSKR